MLSMDGSCLSSSESYSSTCVLVMSLCSNSNHLYSSLAFTVWLLLYLYTIAPSNKVESGPATTTSITVLRVYCFSWQSMYGYIAPPSIMHPSIHPSVRPSVLPSFLPSFHVCREECIGKARHAPANYGKLNIFHIFPHFPHLSMAQASAQMPTPGSMVGLDNRSHQGTAWPNQRKRCPARMMEQQQRF